MLAIQLLILGLIFIVIPAVVGRLFVREGANAEKWPFMWISGQILLWAVFQLICVPLILMNKQFSAVVLLFNIATGLLVLAGTFFLIKSRKAGPTLKVVREKASTGVYVLWGLFAALLLVQILAAVFLAYEEGDDAFYIAISTSTVDSDFMYDKLPYTGGATGLDIRHGLAPFPIWIAYLAKMSGMEVATVAHIAAPIALILMTYGLYFCIGKVLFKAKEHLLPLFLILVEVMILFGGYTTYSAENFLLVRTAQGKAVLANIVIPLMFLLLFLLVEKMQKEEQAKWEFWVLLECTMMTGCLCSTLGTLLVCMFAGVVGLCILICYRKWKTLIPMVLCCAPPVAYAALYFLMG